MNGIHPVRHLVVGFWICAVLTLVESATLRAADPPSAAADQTGQWLDQVYRDRDEEHKYVVFLPADYSADRHWPVILFLHGAGERGVDGRKQTNVGLGPFVKARAKTFPFVVVFPQCEDTKGRLLEGWLAQTPDGKRALKILDEVEHEFSIDTDHEVLTGWSMGGYGTWSLAAASPERWAAVVPLAGGGQKQWARKLKDVPIWAFHGAKDAAIRPDSSRQMIAALKAAGGHPRYTEVPGTGHDVWKVAYASDELYAWMLHPSTAEETAVPLMARPGQRPAIEPEENEPFLPALEIPNAVYVRLGNDMLDALAYSVPRSVPEDALTGRVDDISDYTNVEGRSFSVMFTGISYSGELERARIKAYDDDRLNIQLGLRNVQLNIGTTYVTGRNHSAVAGPIAVVIGYQRPAWLSFDVLPYIENRKLRLKLLTADFDISYGNWYVTAPAGVSVRGFGMTRSKVSNGLVNGLYGNRERIKREIEAMVPSLLSRLEEKLVLPEATDLVSSLWPLPVYKPRIRVWPSDVSTDENGVSITLGVTAAAVNPESAPDHPRVVKSFGQKARDIPKTTNLEVGVAPNLLSSLTDLLIQADIARIHVLDIPEPKFAPFADVQVLANAIPDLKHFGPDTKLWSELILAAPLTVDASEASSASQQFTFRLPRLLLSIAVKSNSDQKEWTPYAELDFQVAHPANISVVHEDAGRRALKLAWIDKPKITVHGRFAPGYHPQNSRMDYAKLTHLFADGWRGWTTQGPFSQTDVPDIDFGLTKLRLDHAGWSAPYLFVDFVPPGVQITNSTDQPFNYEVKGPYGGWGGPYTLKPGKTHSYEVAYPLVYRRATESGTEMYTLPVGSHSEIRVPADGGPPSLFQVPESIPDAQDAEDMKDLAHSSSETKT